MSDNLLKYVVSIFCDMGLEKFKMSRGGYILLDKELHLEGVKFFIPQILSTGKERRLVGLIGLIKTENIIGKKVKNTESITRSIVYSIFSTNIKFLRDPPLLGENTGLDFDHCHNILRVLKIIPNSLEEFEKMKKSFQDNEIDLGSVLIVH